MQLYRRIYQKQYLGVKENDSKCRAYTQQMANRQTG
jgi:hypothetical protein